MEEKDSKGTDATQKDKKKRRAYLGWYGLYTSVCRPLSPPNYSMQMCNLFWLTLEPRLLDQNVCHYPANHRTESELGLTCARDHD